MKNISHTKKGFALLYVVLVIASIVVAASFASAGVSSASAQKRKLYESGAHVRMIAMQCAENLLMQVRTLPSLSSSGTLSIQSGTCAYTISGGVSNKTITLTASRDNLYRRITITLSQINPVIVSQWIEG